MTNISLTKMNYSTLTNQIIIKKKKIVPTCCKNLILLLIYSYTRDFRFLP